VVTIALVFCPTSSADGNQKGNLSIRKGNHEALMASADRGPRRPTACTHGPSHIPVGGSGATTSTMNIRTKKEMALVQEP
jgi:hypothetical protein